MDFIYNFLDFVKTNKCKFECNFYDLILADDKGEEVVAFHECGEMSIKTDCSQFTDEFLQLMFSNGIKVKAIHDEKYTSIVTGYGFYDGDTLLFTIPLKNQIVINL
jgi:hypothetical protein